MTTYTAPDYKQGISFISADDGAIKLWQATASYGHNRLVATCTTVKDLAEQITKYGLRHPAGFSSSMDFASEYGFEDNDAAWTMWNHALNGYQIGV